MNQNQVDVPSVFCDPKGVTRGSLDRRAAVSPLEFRESFVNNLGRPVTIMHRNGMKIVVPPEPSESRNTTFLCRVTISFRPKLYRDMANFFQGLDPDVITKELNLIREAYNVEIKTNSHRGGEITLDYELTLTRLNQLGGTVYFSEIDKVVTIEEATEKINHPDSEEGRKQRVIRDVMMDVPHNAAVFAITLVDNESHIGPRYVRIRNEVFKLTPVKDRTRRDGIYTVSRNSMSRDQKSGDARASYYGFDDLELLGIYRSYDEADHFGNDEAAHAKELAELRLSTERLKAERELAEQGHKLELLDRDRETKLLTAKLDDAEKSKERVRVEQLHQDELRRNSMKDHFDERSHVRKDQSEGLKFLPTLLIGLGTVAAFMLKGVLA